MHVCGAVYAAVGVQARGLAQWLLDEQRRVRDKRVLSQSTASLLELERRHIVNAMRHREPERGGLQPPAGTASPVLISQ